MPQVDIGQRLYGYSASGNPTSVPLGCEHNGNQYVFLHAGGSGPSRDGRLSVNADGILHSFKSTDFGATWNEVGSGPFIGVNYSPGHTICVDGDTVYVLYILGTTGVGDTFDPAHFKVVKFDLLTDTWGSSTNYSVPELGYIHVSVVEISGVFFYSNLRLQLDLVRRGPGDMVFFFQGALRENDKTRLYYSTFDGTGFSGAQILPDQTGHTLNFNPVGLAVDSNRITHFFYTYEGTRGAGGLGDAIYHVSMDTGGGFGGTELIPFPGVYLSNHLGTASAPIAFIDTELSSPIEALAFVALSVESYAGDGVYTHRLYYASTVSDTGPLTWSSGIITQGVFGTGDTNIMSSDENLVNSRNITLAFADNNLVCAWTFEPFNGGPGWTTGESWTYFTKAIYGKLEWSTPAIATTSTETFFNPVQICSWPMSKLEEGGASVPKAIGILIHYVGAGSLSEDEELTQFIGIPVTPPPKKTKGKPFIEPFIHGQFRKPHRLGTGPTTQF